MDCISNGVRDVHGLWDRASSKKIADGDWGYVTSPHGQIKVKAELLPGIRPDKVMNLDG
jgi:hypothetical protein